MLHLLIAACCLIMGHVHTPSGAPIARAHVVADGPAHAETTTDARGDFSLNGPPGRYALTASARGFATVSVDTGDILSDSRVDIALEPVDSPKLRTIGMVTVNGGYVLARNAVPEMDVTRGQMDALGYTQVLSGLAQIPSAVIQHPDSGSPTAPAVVSLRGPDPSEAQIMLDGQTLNDGNTGDVDLSQFAESAFNSINVTEGLGPADAEGSNTFGGVVNLVSLQPTQTDHAMFSSSIGSYGTTQLALNATGAIGKLGYAFGGNDFQSVGQVNNQFVRVIPSNNTTIYCGPVTKYSPALNCPYFTTLGSTIAARLGLVNLDYNFSQRADFGVRIFTLGDNRDESSALNGIAGNATCAVNGAFGPGCSPDMTAPPGVTNLPNPEFGDHVGAGEANFAQSIRAYDVYSRSVLGSGSLLADAYATDNNIDFSGGGVSPYDVSHLDTRYNESVSWGRTFDEGEYSFGYYSRQESLSGAGIAGTTSQSINSYFLRGAQQFGRLRVSSGLYDADYSTFGNTLNWRLGSSYDLGSSADVHASVGTGFRAPLLLERYYFQPVVMDGVLQPNPGLPPPDGNCVVAGQGNPDEKPEHATEYELGFSKLFSSQSDLDVSFYRSNLRDTIENYYPGGGAVNYCGNPKLAPNGFVYEIPINIGNAVYEGAEARFKQGFPKQHLTMVLSYGLNVAYPYALGNNVSNPTSGGSLVDDEQFLQVPQQQGGAMLIWADGGWHSAMGATFAGNNSTLNQGAYTLVDAAVGKTFGHVDFTVAATNIFNAVSGPFTYYDAGVPYRGLYPGPNNTSVLGPLPTDRLFVQPAAIRFVATFRQ